MSTPSCPIPERHARPAGSTLTVRRPDFGVLGAADLDWTPHAPELAMAANAVSLQMPHVEPLFARIVRRRIDDLPAELAGEARAYCSQELAHHQAHHRLDALVLDRYPATRAVDRWSGRAYRLVERRCSSQLQLAVAAGGETLAYSAARWLSDNHRRVVPDPGLAAAPVYLWHLAEEVEHKSVVFDVWRTLDGSRTRLALGMAVIATLLIVFTALGLVAMMWTDRRRLRPSSGVRVVVWSVSLGMEVLPNMAAALTADHSPRDLVDPPWLEQWLASFTGTPATVAPCRSPEPVVSSAGSTERSSTPCGNTDVTSDPSIPDPLGPTASAPSGNDR